MIQTLQKQEVLEKIAYIGYSILIVLFYGAKYIFDNIGLGFLLTALLLLAYACLGVKLFFTHYTIKEYIWGSILLFLAVAAFLINRNIYLPTNLILILSFKNIDLEKWFQRCFWIALITVMCTMGLSVLGIGGVAKITRYWGRGILETRYTFGYEWPNTCHMYLLRIYMLLILGYYKKLKWPQLVLMFIANIGLFYFTDSRTGMLGISLLLVYLAFIKMAEPIASKKWFGYLIAIGYIGIGAVTLILVMFLSESSVFQLLDKLLTGRLNLAVAAISEHHVSLLGSNMEGVYIDCGWISGLLGWGGIWYLLYHGAILCLIIKCIYKGEVRIPMILFITAVYGICESSVMEKGVAAIAVILISVLLFDNYSIEEKICAS